MKKTLSIIFVAVLLGSCNTYDRYKTAVLWIAISNEDVPKIQELIKSGFDVNASINGLTPLIFATSMGKIPIMKILLESKADPNQISELGETALSSAVRLRDKDLCAEVVKVLIDAGADVNMKTPEEIPIISQAVFNGNPYAIKVLVEAKADVNAQIDSSTPLMFAALRSMYTSDQQTHKEVVEALLEAGANPKLKNSEGDTAADIALKAEKRALEYAARINDKIISGTDQNEAHESLENAKFAKEIYYILKKAEEKE